MFQNYCIDFHKQFTFKNLDCLIDRFAFDLSEAERELNCKQDQINNTFLCTYYQMQKLSAISVIINKEKCMQENIEMQLKNVECMQDRLMKCIDQFDQQVNNEINDVDEERKKMYVSLETVSSELKNYATLMEPIQNVNEGKISTCVKCFLEILKKLECKMQDISGKVKQVLQMQRDYMEKQRLTTCECQK